MPKKELPSVALFRQEKLPFFIPGFPLQSGLKKVNSVIRLIVYLFFR
jgi:hypothetical protein